MMAKKREDRYSSVSVLLEDLRAIQAGEPPLQAHQKFDAAVLANLERGRAHAEIEEETVAQEASHHYLGWKLTVIILTGALIVSILIILAMSLNR